MARIKLELPEKFSFQTEIVIRVSDINYGGHLGNDSLLSILQEARVRFLKSIGQSELEFYYHSMIMSDVAIIFKSESFYGEVLKVAIAIAEISRVGFDMFYSVTEQKTNRIVAHAKTGMICFDYKNKKVISVPDEFKKLFT